MLVLTFMQGNAFAFQILYAGGSCTFISMFIFMRKGCILFLARKKELIFLGECSSCNFPHVSLLYSTVYSFATLSFHFWII